MSHALATQLREGTKEAHNMAENVSFVKCFLQGLVEKKSYRCLVRNFYFVYSSLEAELTRHQSHPAIAPIYFPELWRKSSLERDLAYYYGADWQQQIEPSPACLEYLARIKEISETQPELLVAHAYTRYLGDLSGGQILKNIAKRAMGLPDGEGTDFYEFPAIRNPGPFKKKYRAALDALPISDEMAQAIVKEANHSFHLNMKLFRELEGNWLISLTRLAWNSLRSRFSSAPASSTSPSQVG